MFAYSIKIGIGFATVRGTVLAFLPGEWLFRCSCGQQRRMMWGLQLNCGYATFFCPRNWHSHASGLGLSWRWLCRRGNHCVCHDPRGVTLNEFFIVCWSDVSMCVERLTLNSVCVMAVFVCRIFPASEM